MSNVRRSRGFMGVILALMLLQPVAANAQQTRQPEFRVGIGTTLSHDRGWNYNETIEFFAGIGTDIGSVNVEGGASLFRTFAKFAYPMESPPRPSSFKSGLGARLHVRVPSAPRSSLSAIVGAELIQNRTERAARSTTLGGTAGVGLNFGPDRRGALDLRYVRFLERLGSSRGILPLGVTWRL